MARAAERRTGNGLGWGAAAALAFGTLAIAAKFAYRAGADPVPLLAARFAVAAALLAVYHRARRQTLAVTRPQALRLTFLGIVYGAESFLFFAALDRAPAAVVSLIFYSFPLWTALLSLLTRLERFQPPLLYALVSGMAGLALIFSLPQAAGTGVALALAAALAVSGYLLLAQVLVPDVRPTVSATWTAVVGSVTLTIASAIVRSPLPVAAIPAALALGVATAFAFGALYLSIARIGSARSSIAMMLEPVTTLVLAVLFLGETLAPRMIAGSVLVMAALPILALTRRETSVATVGT
ncbi:MAG: DMT family transporter [Actinomycetota bacterium]|nr:DMT family transporter [Actinomycetota bacterium]